MTYAQQVGSCATCGVTGNCYIQIQRKPIAYTLYCTQCAIKAECEAVMKRVSSADYVLVEVAAHVVAGIAELCNGKVPSQADIGDIDKRLNRAGLSITDAQCPIQTFLTSLVQRYMHPITARAVSITVNADHVIIASRTDGPEPIKIGLPYGIQAYIHSHMKGHKKIYEKL